MTDAVELPKAGAPSALDGVGADKAPRSALSVLQLLALLTLVTVTPIVLFGAGALYFWDRNERRATVNALAAHAVSLSQAVDREIRGDREMTESLAATPILQAGDYETFWRFAHDVALRAGGNFALIDRRLQQIVNTNLPPGSPLPAARASAAVKRVIATGQTVVGNFEPRSVSGQAQFTIHAPVIVDGSVRYVLGYAPGPDIILNLVKETYRPEGWLAAVLDRNGTIAARSVAHEEFFGRPANAEFFKRISAPSGLTQSTDLQGRVSQTAWHTTSHGWKIVVWAPTDVLERPTRLGVKVLAAAALLTLFISLVAAWFFSKLIRRPAARLVKAAHDLGEGEVVSFVPTRMAEANAIGASLVEASHVIHRREMDLRASQAHTTLIMRELSHRSKNLLAMVQAMARQSARASSDFREFLPRFNERLQSLSMSHDLLVKTDWKSVPIRDLILEQLRAFIDKPDERLDLSGRHLMLKPEAAQSLGMVFHELGSNAVKYGGLSVPQGVVHISWTVEDDDQPMLVLRWRETGGPPVREPNTHGFGTTIIQTLIPTSLRGEAKLSWDAEGFSWTLRAPLAFVSWPEHPRAKNADT